MCQLYHGLYYAEQNFTKTHFYFQFNFYEVWIQCPTDDTKQLENAILSSNVIDWSKEIMVPILPQHVFEVLLRVTQKKGVLCERDRYPPLDLVIYEKTKPPFKNVW